MNLSTFKNSFSGGTRANRFLVSGGIAFSTTSTSVTPKPFHIRSTFIPPITNITLELHGYGRKVHIPGDRQYAPWQISIYDDLNGSTSVGTNSTTPSNLWADFSNWSNRINNHKDNTPDSTLNSNNYKRTWKIEHLDLNGDTIKTFTMNGCWPKTVSAIDHNMANRNFLNTFSVVMLYDDIVITGADTQA
jgi:hypothetical protein